MMYYSIVIIYYSDRYTKSMKILRILSFAFVEDIYEKGLVVLSDFKSLYLMYLGLSASALAD